MTRRSPRGRRRRLRTGAAVLSVAVVALAACTSGTGAPSPNGKIGSTLVMATSVKFDTLDPGENAANVSVWLDETVYSRLVAVDASGAKIVPDLASRWDISSDKLTYTFHLRDAKFSDGSPVTAQDAAWSINRARKVAGGWGVLLTAVRSVQATDARTVEITLSAPHAPLLADLAMYAYSVLPQKQTTAQGKEFFRKPIGSGPFVVTRYDPDSEVDLAVNKYWYGAKPKIRKIEMKVVPNDNTRLLDLQAGKVDVIENPPSNLTRQINSNPKLKVDLFPSDQVDFIPMSGKNKYFKNALVRQAVRYAIDLDEVNKLAYANVAKPATSFLPDKMPYWNAGLPKPATDLGRARKLLAQAGFSKGFRTTLTVGSGESTSQAAAIVIKSDLAKIGITVDIESLERVTAADKERTGNYGMGVRHAISDIVDPDEIVAFGVVENAGAHAFDTYWDNPTVARLAAAARSETDTTARRRQYDQIQQIVWDETPFLPLAYPPFRYAQGKWVKGFRVSSLGAYNASLLTLTVGQH